MDSDSDELENSGTAPKSDSKKKTRRSWPEAIQEPASRSAHVAPWCALRAESPHFNSSKRSCDALRDDFRAIQSVAHFSKGGKGGKGAKRVPLSGGWRAAKAPEARVRLVQLADASLGGKDGAVRMAASNNSEVILAPFRIDF